MTKRCIAMVLLLLVACLRRTDASEITRSLRRIRKQQQALESGDDDESSKDAVASKAKKVVPSDGIEYWKLRMLPLQQQAAEDPEKAQRKISKKLKKLKAKDEMIKWHKRLQTAEVQELINSRMQEQQFRAMDNIRDYSRHRGHWCLLEHV